jgi:putative CocE/NonD family hydrolase
MDGCVRVMWGRSIRLRDGVHLSANLYLPGNHVAPSPAIVTLTPYVAQTFHDRGMYFAAHGYPFLVVDVRGRGNSEGTFQPLINEARDGFDVVEWLAGQPYCNGKVAMWGGSYSGYAQWATAKERPPHLATIVPVAAPYAGVDFPSRNLLPGPYLLQWLMLVWGRTSQDKLFWGNERYWGEQFRRWFESGAAFADLDAQLGFPSAIFQEWLAHPHRDSYWDSYNPTSRQYAEMTLPVLTITGTYDGDQPGALAHYREHLRNASQEVRSQHYLIIGPWDHAGTRTPVAEFCGVKVGPASLLDLPSLHREWFAWIMQQGAKPQFLQKNVAYYVMGAEKWRYADTLESITERVQPFYLDSFVNPDDVFRSGVLSPEPARRAAPDWYRYDPLDVSLAGLESTVDPENRSDHRMIYAAAGKRLVYHSAPFADDGEISGFFALSVWLSLDQPDTDFRVAIYEVDVTGAALQLTSDTLRARYRESPREPRLIDTTEPLHYEFRQFTFVSRQVKRGNRLRLVLGPIDSIYSQKNYNSGGVVSGESSKDARPVTVKLFHDEQRPSVLHVPFARAEI